MSIEFNCQQCDSVLRVETEVAGKRARCPHCGGITQIPGLVAGPSVADAADVVQKEGADNSSELSALNNPAVDPVAEAMADQPTVPPTVTTQQFFIESVAGKTYGPVTQVEMDSWATEGRISPQCRIRPTGQRSSLPAHVYYPELATHTTLPEYSSSELEAGGQRTSAIDELDELGVAGPSQAIGSRQGNVDPLPPDSKQKLQSGDQFKQTTADRDNPFASPGTAPGGRFSSGNAFEVQSFDLDVALSRSLKIFLDNLGLLLAISLTCFLVRSGIQALDWSTRDFEASYPLLLAGVAKFLLFMVETFLVIGQVRICLRLSRGERATYSQLFEGGDVFWQTLLFTIIWNAVLVIGLILLIVPGVLLVIYFWPAYFLIVDRKTMLFDSFPVAYHLASANVSNGFLMLLVSVAAMLAGLLAFCVGVFFAFAFVTVLWSTAYLMASGQVRVSP